MCSNSVALEFPILGNSSVSAKGCGILTSLAITAVLLSEDTNSLPLSGRCIVMSLMDTSRISVVEYCLGLMLTPEGTPTRKYVAMRQIVMPAKAIKLKKAAVSCMSFWRCLQSV